MYSMGFMGCQTRPWLAAADPLLVLSTPISKDFVLVGFQAMSSDFAHSMEDLFLNISEMAKESEEEAAHLFDEDDRCSCEMDAAQFIQGCAKDISAQFQLQELWEGHDYLPDELMPCEHSLVEIGRLADLSSYFRDLARTETRLIVAALGNQINLVSRELQQRHARERPDWFQLVASSHEVMPDTNSNYKHPTGSPRSSEVASYCSTAPAGITGPWDEVEVAAFLQGFDVRKLISLIDHSIRYKATNPVISQCLWPEVVVKFKPGSIRAEPRKDFLEQLPGSPAGRRSRLLDYVLSFCELSAEEMERRKERMRERERLLEDIETMSTSLWFSKDVKDVRDTVVEALESESLRCVKRPNKMAGRVKRGPYAVDWEIRPRRAWFERTHVSLVVIECEDE